jgi:phage terminase large subunit-like protein
VGKYEVKEPTPEEVQKFHQANPVALLEDGELVKFCPNQEAAERVKEDFTNYETIEKRLDEWVWAIAEELDEDHVRVWQMVHEVSESKQFGV